MDDGVGGVQATQPTQSDPDREIPREARKVPLRERVFTIGTKDNCSLVCQADDQADVGCLLLQSRQSPKPRDTEEHEHPD
jgi:hypothetical protein